MYIKIRLQCAHRVWVSGSSRSRCIYIYITYYVGTYDVSYVYAHVNLYT